MQRYLLAKATDWGVVDELIVDPSGLARISGWSHRPTRELDAPKMEADIAEVPLVQKYRYPRPDVTSDQPLAGVSFEFLLPVATKSVSVKLKDGTSFRFALTIRLYHPDYGGLFAEPRVLKRQDIYGSGPPAPSINDDVRRLAGKLSGRVLDFGCGSGALVTELRAKNVDAIGLELDRPAIREHLRADAAPFVTMYKGGKAPFDDNHFDWVTAFEVIEHIDAYPAALTEIARLAPRFVMSVPDIGVLPLCHRHNIVPWHLLESTHVNFFTELSLRKALEPFYKDIDIGRIGAMEVNGTQFHVSLLAIANR